MNANCPSDADSLPMSADGLAVLGDELLEELAGGDGLADLLNAMVAALRRATRRGMVSPALSVTLATAGPPPGTAQPFPAGVASRAP